MTMLTKLANLTSDLSHSLSVAAHKANQRRQERQRAKDDRAFYSQKAIKLSTKEQLTLLRQQLCSMEERLNEINISLYDIRYETQNTPEPLHVTNGILPEDQASLRAAGWLSPDDVKRQHECREAVMEDAYRGFMQAIADRRTIDAIKALRTLSGSRLGLKDSKDIVEGYYAARFPKPVEVVVHSPAKAKRIKGDKQ